MNKKKLLKIIGKHRKAFLLETARRYNIHALMCFHSTTGYQYYIYNKYRVENPNHGDRLLALGRALHEISGITFQWNEFLKFESFRSGYTETIEFLEELYILYWNDVKERYKQKGIKMEKMRATQIVSELLHRGFLLQSDILKRKGDKFKLVVYIDYNKGINMVWKQGFLTKTEALKINKNFAIGKSEILSL